MSTDLTAHYAELVRHIETLVTSRVPRLLRGPGLSDEEVATIAAGFEAAHRIATSPARIGGGA